MSDEDKDKDKEESSEPRKNVGANGRRGTFGVRYLIIGLVVIVGGIFAFGKVHQRLIWYEYDARIAGDVGQPRCRLGDAARRPTHQRGSNAGQDRRPESKLLVKQLEASATPSRRNATAWSLNAASSMADESRDRNWPR